MKKTLGTLVLAVLIGNLGAVAEASKARTPANDDVAAAQVVETLPFSTTLDIRGATLEAAEARPSCSRVSGSVWYALAAPEDGTVIGEVSSTFASVVAVYEPAAEAAPSQLACASGAARSTVEFKASAGTTYLIQVAAATAKRGIADVAFELSPWKDVALLNHVLEPTVEEQHLPLVRVEGRPRPSDPSMYEVVLTVGDRTQRFGILTYGLVKEKVERELVHVPKIATKVRLQITGRYDSSQYRCALDDGSDTCYGGVPLRDLNWLGGGDGSRAELVVTISAEKDGRVLVERSQSIPYAGQALGLIP
ncbi:MAG: hypothetical protein ABR613_06460 [Actinomycetota bacterium]